MMKLAACFTDWQQRRTCNPADDWSKARWM